jgi:hypothetical protein
MSAYGARAAVLAALDKVILEDAILQFQLLHFGKADAEECILVAKNETRRRISSRACLGGAKPRSAMRAEIRVCKVAN